MEKEIKIERFENNPLLVPEDVDWVMKQYKRKEQGVLNCGVVFEKKDNRYKMLFRGGAGAFSDIGFAESEDGVNWQALKEKPVLKHSDNNFWNGYCKRGIEDPRIVKWIEDWYYIFATACSSIGRRVGIWKTTNFLDYQWVGIPFDIEDKDTCIIPEIINGWAYLIHRKAPHIWISRTQHTSLKSGWEDDQILLKVEDAYQSSLGILPEKIGIAGPPIKLAHHWLTIIHAVHKEDQGGYYSLGFILLDLEDPTKVNYVHPEPILWPEEEYECIGQVPRVCFSCATVDNGNVIYIYWGGADTVICGGKLDKKDILVLDEEIA